MSYIDLNRRARPDIRVDRLNNLQQQVDKRLHQVERLQGTMGTEIESLKAIKMPEIPAIPEIPNIEPLVKDIDDAQFELRRLRSDLRSLDARLLEANYAIERSKEKELAMAGQFTHLGNNLAAVYERLERLENRPAPKHTVFWAFSIFNSSLLIYLIIRGF